MKNNHTPEIRFLGFNGDWEQCKLDLIVDRVKSYPLSRDVETSEFTGYKYIHYGDIHTKVADVIDESSNLPNIKAGNYELLQKGDLVLADASEDYQGIATPAVITIDTPYKLVSGLHTIALRPKRVDSLFLYYLIHSPTFRKYGYKTGTGMKVFGISVTNLLEFIGKVPLLEEQTKIGKFLKQLDDTIALYQQELTTLKQTKQGFFQKMFPKEGESVPEIRFPGFSREWEERRLGEISEIVTGSTPSTSNKEYYGGDFLFVSPADIQGNRYVDATITTLSKNGFEKGRKIKSGSTLFVSIGSTIGKVAQNSKEVVTNQQINSVIPSEKMDKNFIFSLLEKHSTSIKKLSATQAVPIINKNTFSSINIMLPIFEEQIKIGNFFKQLDDTITLYQRELEALKEMKKAFIQKMFV